MEPVADNPPSRAAKQIKSGVVVSGPNRQALPVRSADGFQRNSGYTFERWKVLVKQRKAGKFHLTFSSHPNHWQSPRLRNIAGYANLAYTEEKLEF